MKKKTVIVTYYRGNKQLNGLLRSFALRGEGEGVFIQEKAAITLNSTVTIDEAWKEKFEKALIEAWDACGFEVRDCKFMMEL